ncbi:hypothetical protein C6P42_000083 [Pichia californica]|nr:hypothetical protein C6P42_000083 [[Candida] californica]
MSNSMNSSSSSATKMSNGGLDLDFLDTYVSKPSNTSNTSSSTVNNISNKNKSTTVSDIDDLLFSIPTSKSNTIQSKQQQQQQQRTNVTKPQNIQNNNLLDDFFGQPISSIQAQTSQNKLPTPTPSPNPSTNDNVFTSQSNLKRNESMQEQKDSALAELMDMGFSLEKANIALEATSTGCDINEAISFLMEQAHSSSRKQSRNSTQRFQSPQKTSEDDLGKFVNDISADLMSTASFLFNSGKKKIQQGVEMYRQQKLDSNDGQPIWMKNQMKYKANSMKLPNEEDNEMDPETMKNLIQQQRLREQRFQQEKNQDVLSREKSSTPESPSSYSTIHSRLSSIDGIQEQQFRSKPVYSQSQNQPQRLSSSQQQQQQQQQHTSKPTSSASSEIYVSSSRHRTRKPTSQVTEIPSLIETTSTSNLKVSKSSGLISIPPLDSAQKMVFSTSRELAQEQFKAGDYTSSLENYIAASNVIPSDHPFQIILNSNLALVYSKLGNPKNQLIVSNKGLELISKLTNKVPINKLSIIILEGNKNLKSFWIKLMTKRAESFEFTEKWIDAKESYEKLISEGESTKAIMDGKNRCLKALNPRPLSKQTSKASIPSKPSPPSKPSNSSKSSENLKTVQESNKNKEREDEEKFNLHDKVEGQLDRWRMGNKDNIRALICSLDNILWSGLNWKPVKLTDLVLDNKVKIYYMKAVAKTHPDKISSNESTENKMIANGVFITLNEAWETFKQSKGM